MLKCKVVFVEDKVSKNGNAYQVLSLETDSKERYKFALYSPNLNLYPVGSVCELYIGFDNWQNATVKIRSYK